MTITTLFSNVFAMKNTKTVVSVVSIDTANKIKSAERDVSCDTCPACEKKITPHNALVNHMRIHTGEKPFACKNCTETFAQQSALTEHMKNHDEKREYHCPYCSKSFKRKIFLTLHIRTHTKFQPYKCSCGKSFAQRSQLSQHIKRYCKTSADHTSCTPKMKKGELQMQEKEARKKFERKMKKKNSKKNKKIKENLNNNNSNIPYTQREIEGALALQYFFQVNNNDENPINDCIVLPQLELNQIVQNQDDNQTVQNQDDAKLWNRLSSYTINSSIEKNN